METQGRWAGPRVKDVWPGVLWIRSREASGVEVTCGLSSAFHTRVVRSSATPARPSTGETEATKPLRPNPISQGGETLPQPGV